MILLIAPAIGFFLDAQLFRRIEGQPIVIGVIATVGLTVLLQGIVFALWGSDDADGSVALPDEQRSTSSAVPPWDWISC